jgi:hypothetical protein
MSQEVDGDTLDALALAFCESATLVNPTTADRLARLLLERMAPDADFRSLRALISALIALEQDEEPKAAGELASRLLDRLLPSKSPYGLTILSSSAREFAERIEPLKSDGSGSETLCFSQRAGLSRSSLG